VNKAFAIATEDGRPYRPIRVVALAAVISGVFWIGMVFLFPVPDLARAAKRAAEVQAIIRQDAQFAEVRVDAVFNGKLSVIAREDLLSAQAKAQLAQLVAQHAPGTEISWVAPVPDSVSPQPK
jgi:hypothetical protein